MRRSGRAEQRPDPEPVPPAPGAGEASTARSTRFGTFLMALAIGLTLAGDAFVSARVSSSITRPLLAPVRAAQHVARGDLAVRLSMAR